MTNHSPNTEQRERDAFERWMTDEAKCIVGSTDPYTAGLERQYWSLWQAARATQAAPASPEPAACGGCYGHGMVGNIIDQDVCPFCKGTGAEGTPDRAPASPNTGAVGQKPNMEQMMELMEQASRIAPDLTTAAPIPLTAIQVAWIVGKLGILATPSPSKGGELAAARELIAAFESSMEGCRDQSWSEWQNGHGENVGKRIEAARTAYAASKGGEADSAAEARDAARYRWLRDQSKREGRDGGWWGFYDFPNVQGWNHTPYAKDKKQDFDHATVDAAIDAAISATQPKTNEGTQ